MGRSDVLTPLTFMKAVETLLNPLRASYKAFELTRLLWLLLGAKRYANLYRDPFCHTRTQLLHAVGINHYRLAPDQSGILRVRARHGGLTVGKIHLLNSSGRLQDTLASQGD